MFHIVCTDRREQREGGGSHKDKVVWRGKRKKAASDWDLEENIAAVGNLTPQWIIRVI